MGDLNMKVKEETDQTLTVGVFTHHGNTPTKRSETNRPRSPATTVQSLECCILPPFPALHAYYPSSS